MSASSRGPKTLALANLLVALGVVAWNYYTAVFGLAGNTVGGMSDEYDTLFTPAGYAFSIWGLIFLGLIANAGYQLWLAFSAHGARVRGGEPDSEAATHEADFFRRLGPWLLLTNVANCLWTVVWLTELTAVSVVVLASMVVFLQVAMWRLDMEIWDAPLRVIALVWWPIVIYAGWVTVAVLANLSAFLAKHDVVSGDSAPWAIAMIGLATAVNLALIATRNLREHAVVAIWAFVAIAVEQWGEVASVQVVAVAAAAALALAVSVHAFRNRATLPLVGRAFTAR